MTARARRALRHRVGPVLDGVEQVVAAGPVAECKACARERARAHRRGAFDPARADKQYQTITEGAAA